jgi:hypothetical protein
VAAVLPANGATVNEPTRTLTWTFTSTRAQAYALITVWDSSGADDVLVWSARQDGAGLAYELPPYLLVTGKEYTWTIEAFDELGFSGTTTPRTFTTSFTAPAQLTGLAATPSAADSSVTVTWTASTDPYLDHYRVWWQAGDGTWVRIDGGPEAAGDGRTKLVTASYEHFGARYGANAYRVEAHNGAQASTYATTSGTLTATLPGRWVFVIPDEVVLALLATQVRRSAETITERYDPPGRDASVHLVWGQGPRSISLTTLLRPSTDGDITDTLDDLAAGDPGWLKAPAGWLWDPMWCRVVERTDEPRAGGLLSVGVAFQVTEES